MCSRLGTEVGIGNSRKEKRTIMLANANLTSLAVAMGPKFDRTWGIDGQFGLEDPRLTVIQVRMSFLGNQHRALARAVDEKITTRPGTDFKKIQGAKYVPLGKEVIRAHDVRMTNLNAGLQNNNWRLFALYKTTGWVKDQNNPRGSQLEKTTIMQEWCRLENIDDGARPTKEGVPIEQTAAELGISVEKLQQKLAALDALPKVKVLGGDILELIRELNRKKTWKDVFVWENPPGMYPDRSGKLAMQNDGILAINVRGPSWDQNAEDATNSLVVHNHQLMVVKNLPPGEMEE